MVDPLTLRRLGFRAIFAGLSVLILFILILPFHTASNPMSTPDLLVLLAFAWVLRRPDYVPVLLVAAVILMSDILFMRPLGLWTALVVAALEFLRGRGHLSSELPFPVEWALVAATLTAISAANVLVLAVFMVPQPPFTAILMQVFVSVAVYPLVVAFSAFVVGVRPPAPSEREGLRA
ncbi:rod shape-determining protein MreD [Maribius pontilimi]|uniref:Rod shape-determining protein MreD n=1 Tax=Palleronia pontilimi TaxID=1964209 RepID=A0A934IG31_9RHOB|nr:rod shape-determining protein MreD [Palleronia pontilimi]MBJ3762477.1 rod shape-determining protein MreD [Palleronia pontilimi]